MTDRSPLVAEIRRRIETEGPLSIEAYMELCLAHPEHGYYMGRDPFGRAGDFVTASEISQMFGELIGVWCVTQWTLMGRPDPFNLVEVGPGRGTLMRDLLRAARSQAAFLSALRVHLVESSPKLLSTQRQALALHVDVLWHSQLNTVPPGPTILIANEFFDALPIRQFVRTASGWAERCVGFDAEGALAFTSKPSDAPTPTWTVDASPGEIIEFSPIREGVAEEMGRRLEAAPGGALVIDYGHPHSAPGDTLQAVARHRYADVLDDPGSADLTAHVDFEALAKAFERGGARAWPLLTQGRFLRDLRIEERAAALRSKREASARSHVDHAVARLVDASGMGHLFKVLIATHPELGAPYPFPEPDHA